MVNPRTANASSAPVDRLGDGLHLLRFTGALYCRAELTAPWGVEFPELDGYMKEHAAVATQDFTIWEHKRYESKPTLCDADGPIGEHRRWAQQFYVDAAAR